MARSTRKRAPSRTVRMRDGAPPVVEDTKLPRMGERAVAPVPIGRRILLMPDEPARDTGKRQRMSPAPRRPKSETSRTPRLPLPDQTKGSGRGSGGGPTSGNSEADGYLRFRVKVEDGALSLAGAKFVLGPLVESDVLRPGLVYEVAVGSRRVAAGEIPDAGVWRSFPDPEGRPGLAGHHLTTLPSYEIAVRVRTRDLSMSSLPKTRVSLYRWRGADAVAPQEGLPLKGQLKGRPQEIATLKGIRVAQLPKSVQTEIRRALS